MPNEMQKRALISDGGITRLKHNPPSRIQEFVRKFERVPQRVAHRAERATHQKRAAHQKENRSVNLHARNASGARGALGRVRSALGFRPETCM